VDERTVLGTWWEDNQAAALSVVNGGDISAFGQTVNVGDLRARVTRPGGPYTGFHERVFTSDFTLPPGEGMSYTGVVGRGGPGGSDPFTITQGHFFHYFGRYQPYGVYIPRTKPGPHGVQVMLHAKNNNHAYLVDQPGAQAHLGEEVNRVIVAPLGRGPVGSYSDISEADVLEVLADVKANYDIDHDRVFIGGYSMGGYGALRLGALYPHLFAGFIDWVASGVGVAGNLIDFVGNLRHVPGAMLFLATDNVQSAEALAERFRASDNAYIYYLHAAGEHITTLPTADNWRKEAAWTKDLVRVTSPSRVTYRMDESFWNADYGIRHDRAYWVSGIRPRAAGFADTDVTTHACGRTVPTATTGRSAGVEPVPWVADFRTVAPGEAAAPERRLEATLANVASLTIDASAACLAGASATYQVSTDGPVTLSLSDGRSLRLREAGLHEGTF
jgi:pimeloyl-ACP methyl ester carboxylesterase